MTAGWDAAPMAAAAAALTVMLLAMLWLSAPKFALAPGRIAIRWPWRQREVTSSDSLLILRVPAPGRESTWTIVDHRGRRVLTSKCNIAKPETMNFWRFWNAPGPPSPPILESTQR